MSNPAWEKKATDEPIYEGPRAQDLADLYDYDQETISKIQTIFDAMNWPQLIVFEYSGASRVVAPFVVGVSSEGNPLMRGYQLEGVSRSGKGEGWRMFQIKKMERVENHQDFFDAEDFDFDQNYPWTYEVFKMLQKGIPAERPAFVSGVEEPVEIEVYPEEEIPVSSIEELLDDINNAGDIPEKDEVTLEWLQKYGSKTTQTIGGPSTDIEHEAYSVDLDGITLYYDDLNDAAVTITREMIAGAPLPKTLREQILGIQIVPEDARGGSDVVAMSDNGIVTIFGDRQVDSGVIAHEAAHYFAVNTWGDSQPPEDSDYSRAINSGEPAVSAYSARNRGEDFAEAVRMFVVDPGKLKEVAPRRYQVIKRLMEDQKYSG